MQEPVCPSALALVSRVRKSLPAPCPLLGVLRVRKSLPALGGVCRSLPDLSTDVSTFASQDQVLARYLQPRL